jgi:catechol 2,3-dioxygenase-like lactoylglutathione lyase family enzyme
MAQISGIAISCANSEALEISKAFYERMFRMRQTAENNAPGKISYRLTDGQLDLTLMLDERNAPRVAYLEIESAASGNLAALVRACGGTVVSDNASGMLECFTPDGAMLHIGPVTARPDTQGEARIAHVGMTIGNLEISKTFYGHVFNFQNGKTSHKPSHTSHHMTDSTAAFDIALTLYAALPADQPAGSAHAPIYHWGMEMPGDLDDLAARIKANGAIILSAPGAKTLKFRGPDGSLAEVLNPGGYAAFK